MWLITILLKWQLNRAAYQIMEGRYIDRHRPQKGRFTRQQVNHFLAQTWRNVDNLLPEARLDQLESLGNRQNVFMAVASLAGYRALLAEGIESEYATELFSDVGWKVYAAWLPPLRFLARLRYRQPQKQAGFILRAFMRYPFNQPGYQGEASEEIDHFRTDWTRCAPFEYVKAHGREGELAFFFKTWCMYDWALAQIMIDGGWYEREHTLSNGDNVCDMRWYAGATRSSSNGKIHKNDEFETEKVKSDFQVISISRSDVFFAKLSIANQKEVSR